jgi:hypothetical protein
VLLYRLFLLVRKLLLVDSADLFIYWILFPPIQIETEFNQWRIEWGGREEEKKEATRRIHAPFVIGSPGESRDPCPGERRLY